MYVCGYMGNISVNVPVKKRYRVESLYEKRFQLDGLSVGRQTSQRTGERKCLTPSVNQKDGRQTLGGTQRLEWQHETGHQLLETVRSTFYDREYFDLFPYLVHPPVVLKNNVECTEKKKKSENCLNFLMGLLQSTMCHYPRLVARKSVY